MVVPVLCCQDCRYAKAYNDCCSGGYASTFLTQCDSKEVIQCQYAQANPYTEGVERTSIHIVALAWLAGACIEIYNQRNTHHNKEPHHYREATLIAVELVNQSQQTEQEG